MYKTIVIDPPWKKSTGGVGHATLQPSTHYNVQTKGEIVGTISEWFNQNPVAPEAHMYMWTVNSFTAGKDQGVLAALDVVDRLGFKPVTLIPWVKSNVGSPTPYGMRYTSTQGYVTLLSGSIATTLKMRTRNRMIIGETL